MWLVETHHINLLSQTQTSGVLRTSLNPFPEMDVYRLVCIPENDEYGISAAIGDLGLVLEESELYASHALMAGENSASNLLLKNSKRHKDVKELFQSLSLSPTRPKRGDGNDMCSDSE